MVPYKRPPAPPPPPTWPHPPPPPATTRYESVGVAAIVLVTELDDIVPSALITWIFITVPTELP